MKKRIKTKSVHDFFKRKFREKEFMKIYEETEPLMDIALAIVEARNKQGLSQKELAKKLRTTQSVISRLENGNQNVSIVMLAKIAHMLNCDLTFYLKPRKLAA